MNFDRNGRLANPDALYFLKSMLHIHEIPNSSVTLQNDHSKEFLWFSSDSSRKYCKNVIKWAIFLFCPSSLYRVFSWQCVE
jgi:hypothetical protein